MLLLVFVPVAVFIAVAAVVAVVDVVPHISPYKRKILCGVRPMYSVVALSGLLTKSR